MAAILSRRAMLSPPTTSVGGPIEFLYPTGGVEAVNTHVRLIARIAYRFHSANALIALAMLRLGGVCPPLPGR